ncbi:MAG: bifunctional riboflavin kinase/FAD synthetase [Lachnospiraceae bacterium]
MKSVNELITLPAETRASIALGKFEGLHIGHQKLIKKCVSYKGQGDSAIVFSFKLPGKVLLTAQEKKERLTGMGVDLLLESPLDERIKHMQPEEFVREILVEHLHCRHLVVGEGFRFGYQRSGDTDILSRLGAVYDFSVEVIPQVKDAAQPVSSTYIRKELELGHIEKVNQLLGYRFSTSGEVVHGRGLGHLIGVPTTNLIPPKEKLMPLYGVYMTLSHFENQTFYGMTNVGFKPTVEAEGFLGVETYLYDCNQDLYGENSRVEFLSFLREEKKFESVEALKIQLDSDIAQGKEFIRAFEQR